MKRQALLLATCITSAVALAQAPAPQNVTVRSDRHCVDVHPGDTVHYSLTIEGLENVHTVSADVQMRPRKEAWMMRPAGLPIPDFRSLGGGGSATFDSPQQTSFQFSFVVPKEIYSGRYTGNGVVVRTDQPGTPYGPPVLIDVSRHTMRQVRAFCLNVVSDFGERPLRPEVTGFQPGEIVPK
jgi:hypothetical protein